MQKVDSFSIEMNRQINPAGYEISSILFARKLEMENHSPDLTSTIGLLINEATQPTLFFS